MDYSPFVILKLISRFCSTFIHYFSEILVMILHMKRWKQGLGERKLVDNLLFFNMEQL